MGADRTYRHIDVGVRSHVDSVVVVVHRVVRTTWAWRSDVPVGRSGRRIPSHRMDVRERIPDFMVGHVVGLQAHPADIEPVAGGYVDAIDAIDLRHVLGVRVLIDLEVVYIVLLRVTHGDTGGVHVEPRQGIEVVPACAACRGVLFLTPLRRAGPTPLMVRMPVDDDLVPLARVGDIQEVIVVVAAHFGVGVVAAVPMHIGGEVEIVIALRVIGHLCRPDFDPESQAVERVRLPGAGDDLVHHPAPLSSVVIVELEVDIACGARECGFQ